jgi:hypothetical protein
MAGYTKLFGSILDSTVWQTPQHVRLTWITMLAMADRDGLVEASVPGLALRAGVDRSECEQALALFLAPDPDSRTPDHEGRRIEKVDGGWRLLNHAKYAERLSIEDRLAKGRVRTARWRAAHQGNATRDAGDVTVTPVTSGDVRDDMQTQTQTQIETQTQMQTERAVSAGSLHNIVRARVADALRAAGRPIPPLDTSAKCSRVAEWCQDHATATGATFADVLDSLARGFASASGRTAKAGWPMAFLVANPGEYIRLAPSNPALGGGETDDQLIADLRRQA